MVRRIEGPLVLSVLALLCAGFFSVTVGASQSANYQLDESTIGAGGLVQSSSDNFQSNNVVGDIAIGNSASANYQVEAGSKTTHDPTLSVIINSSSANFGSFSATTAATATASFSVLNYTAYGYVVQLTGDGPTNGSHTIPALSSNTTSTVGTEQFGLNLVANTSPSSVGANPIHGPFSFGEAATNYNTANSYRYVTGETVALAPKSSGTTTYTMSYLVNVMPLTPGGIYKSDQTIIVTGTY